MMKQLCCLLISLMVVIPVIGMECFPVKSSTTIFHQNLTITSDGDNLDVEYNRQDGVLMINGQPYNYLLKQGTQLERRVHWVDEVKELYDVSETVLLSPQSELYTFQHFQDHAMVINKNNDYLPFEHLILKILSKKVIPNATQQKNK